MSESSDRELLTAGIDVGSSSIKAVLVRDGGDGSTAIVKGRVERIRRRDPAQVATQLFEKLLEEEGLRRDELAYVATTGEGENVPFRTGHFYGMTTHARGGLHLEPAARAVIDIGALHTR
ncbi:MAG: BadF/BadG/BcrA/BcrD ATPase family protein, partial [Planctomycetota bacterium]